MNNTAMKLDTKALGAPKKKKRIASLDKRKARAGWLFVLPFVLGFVLIYLPIIFDSIKYSFCSITNTRDGSFTLEFVGFENYRKALFEDTSYVRTLIEGLQQLVFDIPSIVVFSLFIAILLNQKMMGRAAFRAIFFIPVILSTGLIASIDSESAMMEYMGDESTIDTGTGTDGVQQIVSTLDVEALFKNMAVGEELVTYVVSLVNNIYNIVNRSGVQMLIFLAGLQSISPAIYESCYIDGASSWETFWKITFPMISPMILVNAVYTVIDSFTSQSNSVMSYINTIYNAQNGTVRATAMSWMYFLLVVAILALVAGILSAYVFYQRKDT